MQTVAQPAMAAVPLIMEPGSRFYVDPVVVLDFQSLYPSQIIAYNLCFSTCLGQPKHAEGPGPQRLGAQMYGLPKGALAGEVAPDKCAFSLARRACPVLDSLGSSTLDATPALILQPCTLEQQAVEDGLLPCTCCACVQPPEV